MNDWHIDIKHIVLQTQYSNDYHCYLGFKTFIRPQYENYNNNLKGNVSTFDLNQLSILRKSITFGKEINDIFAYRYISINTQFCFEYFLKNPIIIKTIIIIVNC